MTTYLVDTNVLLRLADRNHPLRPTARRAVRTLHAQGHDLRIAAQNGIEFWNVTTRPTDKNGFGLRPADADRVLRIVERLFEVLPDLPAVYPAWRQLVVAFGVAGVQTHDARLVAVMQVHGITHILTFNIADFTRYARTGMVAVNPANVY